MANEKKTPASEELTLEALAAQMKAMLEANEQLREENKALQKQIKEKGEVVKKAVHPNSPPPDLKKLPKEEINLFLDNGKYADDVWVCVNGASYLIQRGKPVEVPNAIAEVLRNSAAQDQAAAQYMRGLQTQYENNPQPGTK